MVGALVVLLCGTLTLCRLLNRGYARAFRARHQGSLKSGAALPLQAGHSPSIARTSEEMHKKMAHLYSAAALLLASTLAMAQPADLLHKAQAGDAQAQLDLGQI